MPIIRRRKCRPASPDNDLDVAVAQANATGSKEAVDAAMQAGEEDGLSPSEVARRMKSESAKRIAAEIMRLASASRNPVSLEDAQSDPNAPIVQDGVEGTPDQPDVSHFHGEPFTTSGETYRLIPSQAGVKVYRGEMFVGEGEDRPGAEEIAKGDADRRKMWSMHAGMDPVVAARVVGRLIKKGHTYGQAVMQFIEQATINRLAGLENLAPELYGSFLDAHAASASRQFFVNLWADYLDKSLKMDAEERELFARYWFEIQVESLENSGRSTQGKPRMEPTAKGMAAQSGKISAALQFYREHIEPFMETMILANGLRPEKLNERRTGVYVKMSRKSSGPDGWDKDDERWEAIHDPDSPYYMGPRSRSLQQQLYMGRAKATRKAGSETGTDEEAWENTDPIKMLDLALRDRVVTGAMRSLRQAIKDSPHALPEEQAVRVAWALREAVDGNVGPLADAIEATQLNDKAKARLRRHALERVARKEALPGPQELARRLATAAFGEEGVVDIVIPWLDPEVRKAMVAMEESGRQIDAAERKGDEALIEEARQNAADAVLAHHDAIHEITSGSRIVYVPRRIQTEWDYLRQYYSGVFWETNRNVIRLKKIAGWTVGVRMLSGGALLGHSMRVLYRATSRTMGGEKSPIRNLALLIGAGPIDTAVRADKMFRSPEGRRMLILLGQHGGLNVSAFSEYTEKLRTWPKTELLNGKTEEAIAAAQGIGEKLVHLGLKPANAVLNAVEWGRQFVFGIRGVDTKLRVYTALKFEQFYKEIYGRKPTASEITMFVNRTFGTYVNSLMGGWVRNIRALRFMPFGPSQMAMIPGEIAEALGVQPRELRGASFMRKLFAALQTHWARVIGTLVIFALANMVTSGHMPWDNKDGHKLDWEFGYGKNKLHLGIKNFFSWYRAARMLGVADSFDRIAATIEAHGEGTEQTLGEITENAFRQAMNYAFQSSAGAPPYNPVFIAALGKYPWLTPSYEPLEATPTELDRVKDLENRFAAAGKNMTPIIGNLWPNFPSRYDTWSRRITNDIFRTTTGAEWEYNNYQDSGHFGALVGHVASQAKRAVADAMRLPYPEWGTWLDREYASLPRYPFDLRTAFEQVAAREFISQYAGMLARSKSDPDMAEHYHQAEIIMERASRIIARSSKDLDAIRDDQKLSILEKRRQIMPIQEQAFLTLRTGVLESLIPVIENDPSLSAAQRQQQAERIRHELSRTPQSIPSAPSVPEPMVF